MTLLTFFAESLVPIYPTAQRNEPDKTPP